MTAKAWEASSAVLRQLDHIGEKSCRLLADRGINTIEDIRRCEHFRIETILNRQPPFGRGVVKQAQSFPQFVLLLETIGEEVIEEGVFVEVHIQVGIKTEPSPILKSKGNRPIYATVLVMTSLTEWIEFRRIKSVALAVRIRVCLLTLSRRASLLLEPKEFTVSCILTKPSQKIMVYAATEQFAGVGATQSWACSVPRDRYPKPKYSAPSEIDRLRADAEVQGFQAKDFDLDDEELGEVQGSSPKAQTVAKKPTVKLAPAPKRGIEVDDEDDGRDPDKLRM